MYKLTDHDEHSWASQTVMNYQDGVDSQKCWENTDISCTHQPSTNVSVHSKTCRCLAVSLACNPPNMVSFSRETAKSYRYLHFGRHLVCSSRLAKLHMHWHDTQNIPMAKRKKFKYMCSKIEWYSTHLENALPFGTLFVHTCANSADTLGPAAQRVHTHVGPKNWRILTRLRFGCDIVSWSHVGLSINDIPTCWYLGRKSNIVRFFGCAAQVAHHNWLEDGASALRGLSANSVYCGVSGCLNGIVWNCLRLCTRY